MSTAASGIQQHSASVTASLVLSDGQLPLAKVGPHRVYLAEAQALPACDAIVQVMIDGHEHQWPVRLPNGAVPFDAAVEIEPK